MQIATCSSKIQWFEVTRNLELRRERERVAAVNKDRNWKIEKWQVKSLWWERKECSGEIEESVRHRKRGLHQRNALRSISNSKKWTLIMPGKQVIVLTFDEFGSALGLSQFFSRLDHPNILKCIAFHHPKEVSGGGGSAPTNPSSVMAGSRAKNGLKNLWCGATRKNYLELKQNYYIMFRFIVRALSYLHSRKFCHGFFF